MSLRQDLLDELETETLSEHQLVQRIYGADFKNYPRHRTGWMKAIHIALLGLAKEGLIEVSKTKAGKLIAWREGNG